MKKLFVIMSIIFLGGCAHLGETVSDVAKKIFERTDTNVSVYNSKDGEQNVSIYTSQFPKGNNKNVQKNDSLKPPLPAGAYDPETMHAPPKIDYPAPPKEPNPPVYVGDFDPKTLTFGNQKESPKDNSEDTTNPIPSIKE